MQRLMGHMKAKGSRFVTSEAGGESSSEMQDGNAGLTAGGFTDLMGNGLLARRVVRKGGSGSKPDQGHEVQVRWWRTTLDTVDDVCIAGVDAGARLGEATTAAAAAPWPAGVADPGAGGAAVFTVGDNEMWPCGVELAVRVMEEGERCLFRMHPRFGMAYAEYGSADGIGLEPGCELGPFCCEVELVRIGQRRPAAESMTPAERLAVAEAKAQAGNALYRSGAHLRALRCYLNGIAFAAGGRGDDAEGSDDHEGKRSSSTIDPAAAAALERLRCNAATALQILGRKEEARAQCAKALARGSARKACSSARLCARFRVPRASSVPLVA
jgi:hypothetical protein